tara:strand:- start:3679 stop:4512 length:834 start_codon:yes stop_codon:yes gene_type:complete
MLNFKKIILNKNLLFPLLLLTVAFSKKNKQKGISTSINENTIENEPPQGNTFSNIGNNKPVFHPSLIIISLTALIYIQGRTYYTGYFNFFNTSPNVFELDLLDYYWGAFQAWFLIGNEILNFSTSVSMEKTTSLLVITTVLLLFAYLASLMLTALSRYIQKTTTKENKESHSENTLIKESARNMAIGVLPTAATFVILIFFSTFVVLLSQPFYLLGKYSAEQQYGNKKTTYLDISNDKEKDKLLTIYCSSSKCITVKDNYFRIVSLPENYSIKIKYD